MSTARVQASFRDPSGFVYWHGNIIRRQVNESYRADYDFLMSSGLYESLVHSGLLIPHQELPIEEPAAEDGAYRVIQPEIVPFVSYPYEWSFSQLRDAAITTLEVQSRALDHGMVLKDASAFNIQFYNGCPLLIDTLSFEVYSEGAPWVAYRQFCQHFLAPLLLMSAVDVRLGKLLQVHLDGIPLDLASRLLPRRSWMRPGVALHIHLHARSLARHANTRLNAAGNAPKVGATALRGLIDNLRSTIERLTWRAEGTEWADYTQSHNYAAEAQAAKINLVREYFSALTVPPTVVWDVGANTGEYSQIAAETSAEVVAFDIDPAAVERNYLQRKREGKIRILPLLLDLTNPTPAVGWANAEREAWRSRGPADVLMALALVHHLAISNNVPFDSIANLFATLAPVLIIEFVPKVDSQVQRLLGSRTDIFSKYTQAEFEAGFGKLYRIVRSDPIAGSDRRLYLMMRN